MELLKTNNGNTLEATVYHLNLQNNEQAKEYLWMNLVKKGGIQINDICQQKSKQQLLFFWQIFSFLQQPKISEKFSRRLRV